MTSNNELRDRIAEVMNREDTPEQNAQVIIDDLHLEAYDFTTHDGHTTNHVHGWWKTQ